MADAAVSAALLDDAIASAESPARRALRRLVRRKGAMLGLAVIALFVAVAIFAPLVAMQDPTAQSWTSVRKPPSALHLLGTDDVGRDILAPIIFRARASLLAGVISVAIALAIGVPLGLMAGYVGGFLDAVIGRLTDAMLAIPFLILAVALAAFLGPSLHNAMVAIGITTTPIFVRLTRGQVMAVKAEDYVEAAIIAEAALSFLGLGQQPPEPSWGSMLNAAQRFLGSAPWMAVWPGLAIFLTVLSFNLLGDGLRDAFDPRER